jgi:hypothetical protein
MHEKGEPCIYVHPNQPQWADAMANRLCYDRDAQAFYLKGQPVPLPSEARRKELQQEAERQRQPQRGGRQQGQQGGNGNRSHQGGQSRPSSGQGGSSNAAAGGGSWRF